NQPQFSSSKYTLRRTTPKQDTDKATEAADSVEKWTKKEKCDWCAIKVTVCQQRGRGALPEAKTQVKFKARRYRQPAKSASRPSNRRRTTRRWCTANPAVAKYPFSHSAISTRNAGLGASIL